MSQKLNIIVMNHGEFGTWLIKSAEMIVGEIKDVYAFSLTEGKSIENLIKEVTETFDTLNGETVLLTDMYGGTPNNAALVIQQKYQCRLICGMNLPILLELILIRDRDDVSLDVLIKNCVAAGKKSIESCISPISSI